MIAPDFTACVEFCHANGMFMVEDAAHAHGSAIEQGNAGSLGDAGAFSFFPTKVMTTLEGGMITTNDDHIAAKAKSFRNQGKAGATFGNQHVDLGNSWRINEISAAIGVIQLRKLDSMVQRRENGAQRLVERLPSLGLEWCSFEHMRRFSGYKLIIRVPDREQRSVEELKNAFADQGVHMGGGVYDTPCHLQPVFAEVARPPTGYPVAERWCPQHLCPPITSGTTDEDCEQMRRAFEAVFGGDG